MRHDEAGPPPPPPPTTAALSPLATADQPPPDWTAVPLTPPLTDVLYDTAPPLARITINRPAVHNAFRPTTLRDLDAAFRAARDDPAVRVILLTGAGTAAFCSGGDQSVRGHGGYADASSPAGAPSLSVLDLHILMRRMPKVIIAVVAGYAVGGGHILHLVADLTIAADNAVFGQVGPRVGSVDGGYGSAHLARIVGQKRAREVWMACRLYPARTALSWGLVNAVVPVASLAAEATAWAREIAAMSPTAIAVVKAAMNADEDGQGGLSQLAGEATRLFYMTAEGKEGRNAFLEKRRPDFARVLAAEGARARAKL